jgi:hypothetical protein
MQGRDLLIQDALVRTAAFFDVLEYAPAWSECAAWVEWGGMREIGEFANLRIDELSDSPNAIALNATKCQTLNAPLDAPPSAKELVTACETLCGAGILEYGMGRVALAGRLARHLATFFDRMPLQARKLRRAHRVARFLAKIPGIRFVALANTTALGNARDGSDLDFFVIAQSGRLWTARLLSAGPYRLLGKLSGPGANADAVCLSYFVSDAHLDLSDHILSPDDPYFRYWFLSLLPLYDDGIGEAFWEANQSIVAKHPRAMRWEAFGIWHLAFGDGGHRVKRGQMPNAKCQTPISPSSFAIGFEKIARSLQRRWFPARIRERMNKDTSVVVSDDVLKFHIDDARLAFREAYEDRLRGMPSASSETMKQWN